DEKTVGVRPGAGEVRIELSSDGPTLGGRVLNDDDQPVPDATVFLRRQGGGQAFAAQCDQSGAYSFSSGVAPGEYKVVAVRNLPESQRWNGGAAARLLSGATDVKLGARERKLADLRVREAM
ncbi:MAG TPA: carboxypeptidase-like regulatory domain-containing protein, partial [Bryobacteraceae bacterium]|nr:carboxypeptidase-like regulatory domain-containing protein [Bryobacteraceae bacterium]